LEGGITIDNNSRKEKRSRAVKKRRTVLVLPSSPDKKVLTISLPSAAWFALCGFIFAVPFLAGTGLWSFHLYNRIAKQTHELKIKNHALRGKLDEQKKRIESMSGELVEIREKARFIQKFLGLKGDGEHEGRIGQGGMEISPERMLSRSDWTSSQNHPSPKKQLDSPTGITSLRSTDPYQLNKDLESIIGTLEERQERLDSMPSISPVDPKESWLSSSFGLRTSPFTGKKQFHPGVDIAGSKGTPIFAPAKGKVSFVGKNGSLGLCIEIEHNSSFKTTYGHLLESSVKKGRQVQRGDIIGYMGDSGRSTGYHLHYEIEKKGKRVNPLDYMMDWEKNHLMLAED
jgi:murein DD-endopeptidase MepM/ murein hydrolase activator NlpD